MEIEKKIKKERKKEKEKWDKGEKKEEKNVKKVGKKFACGTHFRGGKKLNFSKNILPLGAPPPA